MTHHLPSRQSAFRFVLALLVVSGLLLPLACGGGGGGGGGGTPPPTPPTASLTFTPSSVTTVNSIALVRSGTGASDLVLELRANSVEGLYGLSFDLRFPPNLLRFQGAEEGTFLAGPQTSIQVTESPSGNLIVGLSRLGAAAGVSGSGVLMTLRFAANGTGNGSIDFNDRAAFDNQGLALSGVAWGGGSVAVQL